MRMGNFDFKNLKQFSGKECPQITLIMNKSCQIKNDGFMNDGVLLTIFFPTSQRKILLSREDLKKVVALQICGGSPGNWVNNLTRATETLGIVSQGRCGRACQSRGSPGRSLCFATHPPLIPSPPNNYTCRLGEPVFQPPEHAIPRQLLQEAAQHHRHVHNAMLRAQCNLSSMVGN